MVPCLRVVLLVLGVVLMVLEVVLVYGGRELPRSYSRSTELEVPVEKPTDGYF